MKMKKCSIGIDRLEMASQKKNLCRKSLNFLIESDTRDNGSEGSRRLEEAEGRVHSGWQVLCLVKWDFFPYAALFPS